jgi:universal stress protein A
MSIERILCPVDFSPESDRAMHYAGELANQLNAELTLVHALETVDYIVNQGLGYIPTTFNDDREVWAQDRLDQLAHALSIHYSLPNTQILRGTVHSAISEAAGRLNADLVVMGTHGRTGVGHMLLGSVAEKVVRTCPVPVLTLRRPTSEPLAATA